MQTRRRVVDGSRAVILLFAFFSITSCFLAGCSSDTTNAPPTIVLDPGLVDGDTVSARLSVFWIGSDPDGRIDHYEYALDPSPAFTEEEIAQGGEEITSVVIPGSIDQPTVTRISKTVDREVVSFDWVHTKDISHRFVFSSTQPDSGDSSSTPRFHGLHALYVRAADDDGALSVPDHAAFTSETLAPTAQLLNPIDEDSVVYDGCLEIHFRWKGVDPDGGAPERFLYKLLPVVVLPGVGSPEILFEDPGGWVEYQGTELTLYLSPRTYVFGVRAIDASGAVEPFLEWGRNALQIVESGFPTAPQVTIRLFDGARPPPKPLGGFGGLPVPDEIIAGEPFQLTWAASSICSLDGYSWGLDLGSTDDSNRGWSTWGLVTVSPVLSLAPGHHTFYVRARTKAGLVGMTKVDMAALVFAPDREALFVDDSFDNLDPNDSQHDAFWHSMLDSYAAYSGIPRDQFGEFAVHGDGDRGNLQPNVPTLSELFQYKLLIWDSLGSGYNSDSALIRSTGLSNRLALYLKAGGKLWLGGRMTVAATAAAPNMAGADLEYPITDLRPGDFAWDFLKLHSSKIMNDKGTNNANLFHAARWFPGVLAIYDTMSVDVTKLPLLRRALGGVSGVDAVFDPNFAESEPGFQGDIDTLYAYGAAGPEVQGKTSPYQNKLCALRWHDRDPEPLHGRLQWFGFELYYLHADQAQKTFNQSLDWFREGP